MKYFFPAGIAGRELTDAMHWLGARPETCRRLNFEYVDCQSFDSRSFGDDAETLVVERAGSDSYLVR
jgi:hypothetical protein